MVEKLWSIGHYLWPVWGFDERIRTLADDGISVGDFVLTGGELPTCLMVDSIVRLIPGVLNNYESAESDSFFSDLLDGPHYTRPREFKDLYVPDVLLSGNHQKIEEWRKKKSFEITKLKRPDLLKKW